MLPQVEEVLPQVEEVLPQVEEVLVVPLMMLKEEQGRRSGMGKDPVELNRHQHV